MSNPIISVCIPVFDTEPYLIKCLRSVVQQDFSSFEVVVVSDASSGKNEKGWDAKKIVAVLQKEANSFRRKLKLPKVEIRFISHHENRGILEVRRTLIYESKGTYIAYVDSDDELVPGALSALYGAAQSSGADIVHGTSTAGFYDDEDKFIPIKVNRYGKIFYGKIEGRDIFRYWNLKGELTSNLWGKLIKKELFTKAYENIPYTECNMADDYLIFFFVSLAADSYLGIEDKVYQYRVNSGMSSNRKIDSLHKWKMICSTASVFTIISQWIEKNPQALKDDELLRIKEKTRFYLANNLTQLKQAVLPELKEQARAMLCDFWGQSFVDHMEEALNRKV